MKLLKKEKKRSHKKSKRLKNQKKQASLWKIMRHKERRPTLRRRLESLKN